LLNKVQHLFPSPGARSDSLDAFAPPFRVSALENAERLHINHGWLHRWKSQLRDVGMHAQATDFLQRHGGGSVSAKYGPKWPKTLKKAIEMIPRYRIRGCNA
jgi:hypothetical protein